MNYNPFVYIHLMTNLDFKLYFTFNRIISVSLFFFLWGSFTNQASAQQSEHSTEVVSNYNDATLAEINLDEISLDDVSSGTLLFKQVGSRRFLQAPQLKTTVDMSIKGIVANVHVKQKFTNTTNEWQHAVYVFPLPDNSAVNQLKIKVADRVIIGEIQEKKKALKTFNNAKRNGQKAALVEQYRPNLFSTKVANIPPHQSIEVELTYFQQVDYQSGEFSLHFPMAITPRYQPGNSANKPLNTLPELIYQARNASDLATELALQGEYPSVEENAITNNSDKQLIDLNVYLAAGSELAQINSVNHALISTHHTNINDSGNNQATGDYSLSLVNHPMNKDFKLTWRYKPKEVPQVLNFQQAYQDHKYGLLMVLPGLEGSRDQTSRGGISKNRTVRELTFVLDTSGSMSGQSLSQAKEAFNFALKSLNEQDSFQLISFNSYPTKLFKTPVPATTENKQQARRYVTKLKSTGGTEIMSALALALANKSNKNEKLQQVVFLTDGAVGNEAEIFSYIADNINDKRLFTVGLGTAPNRYFMKKAAEIGRGSYQFISNHSELVKEMQRLFSKLSNPVLTDLKLTLNDLNGKLVTTPDPIPDVYQGEPLFLSYQVQGQQTDSLLTGGYKGELWSINIDNYVDRYGESYIENVAIVKPKFDGEIPPLATLWARRKIADHFRELMLYKSPESKADIITLALKYNLVTSFTSLVAVEKEISRPQSLHANAKQLKSNIPAGQKLPSTALNWQWNFYIGLLLFIFSVSFMCIVTWREKRDLAIKRIGISKILSGNSHVKR